MSDTTVRRPIRWRSFSDSNVGAVRQINEDSVMIAPEKSIWAVADGMGGYEAGDVASKMVVKTLEAIENKPGLSEIVDSVEDSLIDVNMRILEYGDIMLDGRTLGSTVVVLVVRGRVGVCMWAGDSRLYRFRNGQLLQLSRDHSQVEELISQGFISPEEAESHPDSNVITRAVGAHQELYVDINVFSVQLGDLLLLCSDGLYNAVPKEDIIKAMQTYNEQEIVDSLIQTALANGAPDNVSVVIAKGEPEAMINLNTPA